MLPCNMSLPDPAAAQAAPTLTCPDAALGRFSAGDHHSAGLRPMGSGLGGRWR